MELESYKTTLNRQVDTSIRVVLAVYRHLFGIFPILRCLIFEGPKEQVKKRPVPTLNVLYIYNEEHATQLPFGYDFYHISLPARQLTRKEVILIQPLMLQFPIIPTMKKIESSSGRVEPTTSGTTLSVLGSGTPLTI